VRYIFSILRAFFSFTNSISPGYHFLFDFQTLTQTPAHQGGIPTTGEEPKTEHVINHQVRRRRGKVYFIRYGQITEQMMRIMSQVGNSSLPSEHLKDYVKMRQEFQRGARQWFLAWVENWVLLHDIDAHIHNLACEKARYNIPKPGETEDENTSRCEQLKQLEKAFAKYAGRFSRMLDAELAEAKSALEKAVSAPANRGNRTAKEKAQAQREYDRVLQIHNHYRRETDAD